MTRDEGKAEAFPFGPRQLNDVLPCGLADGKVGEAILGDEAGDEGVPGNLEQPSIGYRERGLLSLFYGRITSKGGQCVKGPDKRKIHPNPDVPSLCFIRNLVRNPQILIGDYTYYDDPKTNGEDFERHVEHLYPFLGDRLIIGKFCAIAKGVRFLMNGANHRMNGITTYPFNILGGGWEKVTPRLEDLPLKGDTVIGNDVWIGQDVTFPAPTRSSPPTSLPTPSPSAIPAMSSGCGLAKRTSNSSSSSAGGTGTTSRSSKTWRP